MSITVPPNLAKTVKLPAIDAWLIRGDIANRILRPGRLACLTIHNATN